MSFGSELNYNLIVILAGAYAAEIEGKFNPFVGFQIGFHNFGLRLPCVTALLESCSLTAT